MKLGIIVGSVRQGRVSDRIAKWVALEAKAVGIEPIIIDLNDYPMPLFNEPGSPQFNPNRQPVDSVKSFLEKIVACDGVALISPEYNRSTSAALKNALDYIDFQLQRKPVMLVAHGSTGGAQAVSHLRGMIPGLLSFTIPTAVMIVGQAASIIDENGNLSEEAKNNPRGPQLALNNALTEIKWYGELLTEARTKEGKLSQNT